jgi:hypothetical protein
VTAIDQQVGLRPGACRRLIFEPRQSLVTHEDQQVDIAPVVCLAAAQRTNQSHSLDRKVSF